MPEHAPYYNPTEPVEIIEWVGLYERSIGTFARHYAESLLRARCVELRDIPRENLELRPVRRLCLVPGCTYGSAKIPESNPLLCADHFQMLTATAHGLAMRLRVSTYSPQRSAKDIAALCKRIVEAIAAEEAAACD